MFTPGVTKATAPRSAPIFTAYDDGADILAYLDGLRATNNATKSAMLAIIGRLGNLSQSKNNQDLANSCAFMFDTGVCGNLIRRIRTDPADPPTDADNIVSMARTQINTAEVWIWDLVNASKKKELTGDNVDGYFSSLGRSDIKGAPIASMINKVANFLPDMINSNEFREGLTDNAWTKYHTSRVSTGKLLEKISEDFVSLNIIEKGGDVWNAIHASAEAPHDVTLSYNIPGKIVGYGALFYQTAGVDVGKWWQGEKNLSKIPVAKVRAIKAVFSKYLEIKNKSCREKKA